MVKTETLRQVRAAIDAVIRLPYGASPDMELWQQLMDARGELDAQIYRNEYATTGQLPEVTA